jgi:hypothetical protein
MTRLLPILAFVLVARPSFAQDVDAMAKWTSYQIVHYKIVGEFSGETVLMKGSGKTALDTVTARVTDRIEVEFDWDQQEFNLVGKPMIRNFPTKVVSIDLDFETNHLGKTLRSRCPEPKPGAALELVTGLSLKADDALRMSGFVSLEVRRDQPGGSYASVLPPSDNAAYLKDAKCGDFWESAKPVSETSTMTLMAVPGMFLAMPSDQGGMKLSADRKSIVIPPGQRNSSSYGWTWTVTPTGVK